MPALRGRSVSGRRLLPVGGEPFVDQRDRGIDDGMAPPLLRGDGLHQLVRALDVGRASLTGRARPTTGA